MAPLVWLVTGCSTGIGLELIHSILARGDKVIATARTLSKIEHLKEAGAHCLRLDVTKKQGKLDEVAREAIAVYGGVDVLVVCLWSLSGSGACLVEAEMSILSFWCCGLKNWDEK